MKYAEQNGYEPVGLSRECYIDGIWNKESEEDWLTEIICRLRNNDWLKGPSNLFAIPKRITIEN